jgi:hypothetical protein
MRTAASESSKNQKKKNFLPNTKIPRRIESNEKLHHLLFNEIPIDFPFSLLIAQKKKKILYIFSDRQFFYIIIYCVFDELML